tara:strand:+ start:188 stop:439 length:252 start_codon:yes stop_codon:yes gene_type:complete
MVARFEPYLSTFKNHGYDLVYVNYDDGQAAIQDNAQVIKRVINEIKNRIPPADSIIYVGKSIGDLGSGNSVNPINYENIVIMV